MVRGTRMRCAAVTSAETWKSVNELLGKDEIKRGDEVCIYFLVYPLQEKLACPVLSISNHYEALAAHHEKKPKFSSKYKPKIHIN
jgi:hypothetical protein